MPITLETPVTEGRTTRENKHWLTKEAYTLVVIDMQPKYPSANDPDVIAAVEKEILDAVQLNMPIIFLEYLNYYAGVKTRNMPPTHERLTDHVKSYPHKDLAEKCYDDGSDKVYELCLKRQFVQTRFRIVGVNTDCCVRATVEGLSELMPESLIDVVKQACNTDQVISPQDAWRWLTSGLSNVKAH